MNKHFLLFVLFFTGCTGSGQLTQPDSFDSESVGTLRFKLTHITGNQLETFSKQQQDEISQEISRRFSQAGYSITYTRSDEPKQNISHVLEASVGSSEYKETPTGFSFGLGNSDPRSSSFQKSVSIPVTCTLRSQRNSDQAVVLQERISIPSNTISPGLDADQQFGEKKRFYIENIGSTCHNLLSKLGILPASTANGKPEDQFAPVVRVETEIENREEKADKIKDKIESRPTPRTVSTAGIAKKSKKEASVETGNQSKNTKTPVAIKNDQAEDLRNKTMKIFNKGDTVILKFGHERK